MRALLLSLGVVLLAGLGVAAQYHYAFYYDLTGGQDLEINIINPMFETTSFTLSVHDAYGAEIWSLSDTVDSAQAGYIMLGDRVPSSDFPWGVVTVQSSDRLLFGLEYYLDGEPVSINNIASEVPVLSADEPYWLGGYYSQAGASKTAVIVMNPWAMTTSCAVNAYNQDGYKVYTRELTLGPYESEYLDLNAAVGSGTALWGFLDVAMQSRAVVVAVEYYGRGSGLLIDNITEYYY
jgi:hypothetical protein